MLGPGLLWPSAVSLWLLTWSASMLLALPTKVLLSWVFLGGILSSLLWPLVFFFHSSIPFTDTFEEGVPHAKMAEWAVETFCRLWNLISEDFQNIKTFSSVGLCEYAGFKRNNRRRQQAEEAGSYTAKTECITAWIVSWACKVVEMVALAEWWEWESIREDVNQSCPPLCRASAKHGGYGAQTGSENESRQTRGRLSYNFLWELCDRKFGRRPKIPGFATRWKSALGRTSVKRTAKPMFVFGKRWRRPLTVTMWSTE